MTYPQSAPPRLEIARPQVVQPDNWSSLAEVRQKIYEEAGDPAAVLLIVEHENERVMLTSMLRKERVRIVDAPSGPAALDMLQTTKLDLVILDRDLMSMDGLECCRRIKATRRTSLTPVLMVTAGNTVADEIAGIQAGADEYLRRPLHPEVFRTRSRALIRHKSAVDRLEETETILFALAQAVEKRDHNTAGHCQRLALFSVAFGIRLGLSQAQLLALHRGGFLHDIGKISIPDAILFKPGKLSREEWLLMQTHSVRGEEICSPLHSLEQVLPIIRNHHERWDGGGYPDGLRGERIPLLARVLQLVDIYDALTTERPYKPAYSSDTALEMLQAEAEMGWRDPALTAKFVGMPFGDLDAAARELLELQQSEDFETSVRNLQRHVRLAC